MSRDARNPPSFDSFGCARSGPKRPSGQSPPIPVRSSSAITPNSGWRSGKSRLSRTIEVYRILQTGHVMEEPTQTERKEWKCKIVKTIKGSREAGVVTVILQSGMLFAMTVEWEDL